MVIQIDSHYDKEEYNKGVNHILQSWQWGEFRQKEGKKIIRLITKSKNHFKSYQLTLHKVPFINWFIGYMPRCHIPTKDVLNFLISIGHTMQLAFIKIEPDTLVEDSNSSEFKQFISNPNIIPSKKAIFAANTFLIDLTQSENELLAKMHPKTRYNIRLAAKLGVKVSEYTDEKSFNCFLKLQRETAKRQGFYIHPDRYYQLLWQTLKPYKMIHLLIAKHNNEPLAAWLLFRFKDKIYYPYGGSSNKNKHLMASNLLAWEVILFGKKLGCKTFDFWGALPKNASTSNKWYGFHRFKAGYGGNLINYVGSFDLIINKQKYQLLTGLDTIRWILLRSKAKIDQIISD